MQLKQGDKVSLIAKSDASLCIYSVNKKEDPREIIITKKRTSINSLRREIIAAYLDGFEIIKLETEENITEEQQKKIRDITNNLFGLEIIEISKDAITIQCLLKRTMEIDKTIQRIYNVISSMFSEILLIIREHKKSLIPGLSSRMQDIRRLSLVTNRLLRSFLLFPTPKNPEEMSMIDCVDYLQILHIISEIACNVNKISESLNQIEVQTIPQKILEPLYQVSLSIQHSLNNSIEALLEKDISLANRTLDNVSTSELNLIELWSFFSETNEITISKNILSSAYLLIDCLKRINQHSAEIAEIAIDRTEAANANNQKIKI